MLPNFVSLQPLFDKSYVHKRYYSFDYSDPSFLPPSPTFHVSCYARLATLPRLFSGIFTILPFTPLLSYLMYISASTILYARTALLMAHTRDTMVYVLVLFPIALAFYVVHNCLFTRCSCKCISFS